MEALTDVEVMKKTMMEEIIMMLGEPPAQMLSMRITMEELGAEMLKLLEMLGVTTLLALMLKLTINKMHGELTSTRNSNKQMPGLLRIKMLTNGETTITMQVDGEHSLCFYK